jgi:hypothetical protein
MNCAYVLVGGVEGEAQGVWLERTVVQEQSTQVEQHCSSSFAARCLTCRRFNQSTFFQFHRSLQHTLFGLETLRNTQRAGAASAATHCSPPL